MTHKQFDAYLEATGNGISSQNGKVSYVSNANGEVVAMFWDGDVSYLETLDTAYREEDDGIFMKPFCQVLYEAIVSALLMIVAILLCASVIIGLYSI